MGGEECVHAAEQGLLPDRCWEKSTLLGRKYLAFMWNHVSVWGESRQRQNGFSLQVRGEKDGFVIKGQDREDGERTKTNWRTEHRLSPSCPTLATASSTPPVYWTQAECWVSTATLKQGWVWILPPPYLYRSRLETVIQVYFERVKQVLGVIEYLCSQRAKGSLDFNGLNQQQ